MTVCGLLLVVSIAGAIVTLLVNSFVLDKYNAYGEVAIPGKGRVHLQAGEVTVSLHALIVGTTSGAGLPVPPLGMTIVPPDGVSEPEVTESIGSTTTLNNDARVRVWLVQVVTEGDYDITAEGEVSAFINPRLAFGHRGHYGRWVWAFVAVSVVSLIGLVASAVRSARIARPGRATPGQADEVSSPALDRPEGGADTAIRLEQLKTLAGLRDSGALTTAEFEAEKRRILDGR